MIKRIVIAILGLCLISVPVMALDVPIKFEEISSQSIGASATITSSDGDATSGARALYKFDSLHGFYAASFKAWGAASGNMAVKLEFLCLEEVDSTFIATHSTAGTANNVIITDTNAIFGDEDPHHFEFEEPPCREVKYKVTNLSAISSGSVHLWIQYK